MTRMTDMGAKPSKLLADLRRACDLRHHRVTEKLLHAANTDELRAAVEEAARDDGYDEEDYSGLTDDQLRDELRELMWKEG